MINNNNNNKMKVDNMTLYRGTKIAGLKEMEPRLVNHDKPYVYATTDKIEAIIYSVKGGNLNYTNIYGYDDDNKRCLIERKANCLEEIYNTEGRYYILDDTNFKKHEELGVGENEYVSELPVEVIKEVTIPNVWEYFKKLEKNNELKIYRYPNRPKSYPNDDSDLIECATLMYTQIGDIDMAFGLLLKHHPELEDRVNKLKEELLNKPVEEIQNNFFK